MVPRNRTLDVENSSDSDHELRRDIFRKEGSLSNENGKISCADDDAKRQRSHVPVNSKTNIEEICTKIMDLWKNKKEICKGKKDDERRQIVEVKRKKEMKEVEDDLLSEIRDIWFGS